MGAGSASLPRGSLRPDRRFAPFERVRAPRARSVSRATLADHAGFRERPSRRPARPERKRGAQALFERSALERHRVVRNPAGVVRAAAKAAQRRDQIVRFLPARFPSRFPFGSLSFGSLSFGRLSLDRLLGFRGTTPHRCIQAREPRLLAFP